MSKDYPAFNKIPRLSKPVVITEKIDGTNGLVSVQDISDDPDTPLREGETLVWTVDNDGKTMGYVVRAGSRNRWLTVEADNYGFARWVEGNATQLATLGVGNHYGEWFGKGIQRGYGMDNREFALFNVAKWYDPTFETEAEVTRDFKNAQPCPPCCTVVPLLAIMDGSQINKAVAASVAILRVHGSVLNGFDNPEGIIVFHTAANQLFKVLLEHDDIPKSLVGAGEVIGASS